MKRIALYCIVLLFIASPVFAALPFTDGFESGNVTAWSEGDTSWSSGSITIESTAPMHNGSYSLQCNTTNSLSAAGVGHSVAAEAKTELWFEFWVYWPSGNTINDGAVVDIGYLCDTGGNGGATVRLDQNRLIYGYNVVTTTAHASTGTLATNTWTKLQLHLKIHASAGEISIWQNGTLILNQTGIDTYDATTDIGTAYAGITWSNGVTNALEMHVDDATVDDALIGSYQVIICD